jgi:hypothetical protein
MVVLPMVVGVIGFMLLAIPYLSMTLTQLWSRRRRFPRKLDIWR